VRNESATELLPPRSFRRGEAELFVNLQRTAAHLLSEVNEMLKPAELTTAQYNVLRILRGAQPDGLACREISARMVTKDSDITRLLDRLAAQQLIIRTRPAKDRRVILTQITAAGLQLLAKLDEPIAQCHRRQLGHLSTAQLAELNHLLESVRTREA
jgi:DNA-binding MarR family transcriptional regulator